MSQVIYFCMLLITMFLLITMYINTSHTMPPQIHLHVLFLLFKLHSVVGMPCFGIS